MANEARFRITNPGIFWSLQTIDQLGDFKFSDTQILEIHDVYLDTKKRRLLTAGYSCRRREQGKGFLITLTKLGAVKDNDEVQKYWEVDLTKNSDNPDNWPKSPVQKRISKTIPTKKLQVIFSFIQTRITRQVIDGNQISAKVILDDVRVINRGKEQHFKILKLTTDDPDQLETLNSLAQALKAEWSLKNETLSKFERALKIESA
jgi:inorganic triphosphatase YgiF